MIVTALPGRPTAAIRNALLSHGWGGASSADSAGALEPWAYHVTGLSPAAVEALLPAAARHGLDLLTGEDWVLLSGTRFRLSSLARSWILPPELQPLAVEIGKGLPADAPEFWRVRSGPVSLAEAPVVFGHESRVGAGEMVRPDDYTDWLLGSGDPSAVAAQAHRTGEGMVFTSPALPRSLALIAAGLDAAILAGLDPEQIAIDPGWGSADGPDLSVFRGFGRPIVCTTDDPVVAALAWSRGAQLFRTASPGVIFAALHTAAELGA